MTDFEPFLVDISTRLKGYRDQGLRVFATSSFQTQSVPLLHILATHAPDVPVVFLNTGYHFPETLQFRRDLASRLDLRVVDAFSPLPRIHQRAADGQLLYLHDPDYCCYLNKVAPLEPVQATHDVWVNGVRATQTENRGRMTEESRTKTGLLRYHPLLRWTSAMVWEYRVRHDLPAHPLDDAGYVSVGCQPCTRQMDPDAAERGGRWFGLKKTECGLHLDGKGPP